MTRRPNAGFTIIEILISVALAGMLLAGAFQLHTTFHQQGVRQQHAADIQQTLRVSRQVLDRALRGAGVGVQGSALQTPWCGVYYPVQFFNRNIYPPVLDSNPADADGDPDWVQVISAADVDPSLSCPNGSCGGVMNTAGGAVNVTRTQNFNQVPNLMVVVSQVNLASPAVRTSCVFAISAVNAAGACGNGNCGTLSYPLYSCAGQLAVFGGPPSAAVAGIACADATAIYPAPVRQLNGDTATVPAVTMLRVVGPNDAAIQACPNPAKTPCLTASFTGLKNPALPNWQLVAENVEDMQIALILNDGRVCGSRDPVTGNYYSVDDPSVCDPRLARAVRYTLTARSSGPEVGFTQGSLGGIEDESANALPGAPLNTFLRRTVTAEVQLRNSP